MPKSEREVILGRKIERIDREDVVSLLEGASIACYESESDLELKQALHENVMDGTIEEYLIDEHTTYDHQNYT